MSATPDPLKVREIVANLPEILAECERVDRDELSRRAAANDATTELAIRTIGHLARCLESARPAMRRPRPIAADLARSMETATRHFRNQVVDLLYQVGAWIMPDVRGLRPSASIPQSITSPGSRTTTT